MNLTDFIIIAIITILCQFLFRTLPVLVFAHRSLPEWLEKMLGYIPVAAFAALVANDLFKPDQFAAGWAVNLLPLLASIPVIIVARKTRSLLLCIVVGVACFALLLFLSTLL